MPIELEPADAALHRVLHLLSAQGYAFTTITPASHARVLRRRSGRWAGDLCDVFGWSLPFRPGLLDPALLEVLRIGKVLEETPAGFKAKIRVSTLRGQLFLHSAYPAAGEQSVFFGPDTHRFVSFVASELRGRPPPQTILEVGAGTGTAGILAGLDAPAAQVTLADINPLALRFARINAAFAGLGAEIVRSDGLAGVSGRFDLIIANPPFLTDPQRRVYRHGGGLSGAKLSLDWAAAGSRRLTPSGRMLLYTGSAIVNGYDRLKAELRARLPGATLAYTEIDPDVFGEELDEPAYSAVDRIAAVTAVIAIG